MTQIDAAGFDGLDTFEYSVWFRAPHNTADGSRLAIVAAPAGCNDRASAYVEVLHNAATGGMDVRYYKHAREGNEGGSWPDNAKWNGACVTPCCGLCSALLAFHALSAPALKWSAVAPGCACACCCPPRPCVRRVLLAGVASVLG